MRNHGFFVYNVIYFNYHCYMKIVIKEITPTGDSLLVYLMTDTNQPVSCNITQKSELTETISSVSNNIKDYPQEKYSYAQYIKQDEQN